MCSTRLAVDHLSTGRRTQSIALCFFIAISVDLYECDGLFPAESRKQRDERQAEQEITKMELIMSNNQGAMAKIRTCTCQVLQQKTQAGKPNAKATLNM